MDDQQDEVLRQAEATASGRQADRDLYSGDRATLHAWLDALDDDDLVLAHWLLEVARTSTLKPPTGSVRVDFREHLPQMGEGPPDMRWFRFLHLLIGMAPPSWFDTPERQSRLGMAAGRAVWEAFDIPRAEGSPSAGGQEG